MKNPFIDYVLRLFRRKKKKNPVHEIVSVYFELKGMHNMPKQFYRGRYSYPKMAREAKQLLAACNNSLDDALWSMDAMNQKAQKGRFDWSISTCLKHSLK